MQLDTYALCPCGSNKKVKFCCCKDLLHDLEKVLRMSEGEQYVAASDQLDKLLASKGPRAALLALKGGVALLLERVDEARAAVAKLLEVMPHSTVGLALQAVLDVEQGSVDDAVEHLQQAIENLENEVPQEVLDAVGLVARVLLQTGHIVGSRAHWEFRFKISQGEDELSQQALQRISQIDRLPPLLKGDFSLQPCPDDVPWRGEFEAAFRTAGRGAWLAACEILESLDQKVPHQPAILLNIGYLKAYLGRDDQAVDAWRKYTTLPGVDESSAVEMEAICQVMSHDVEDQVDQLRVTYEVQDMERLMESLVSHKQFEAVPVNPRELVEEGEPPPKGLFRLLDRPMPASLDGLTFHDLPVSIAEMLPYGRETDRPARLQLLVAKPDLEKATTQLLSIAREYLAPQPQEEVLGSVSSLMLELNPRIRFPRDVDMQRAQEMLLELRDHTYKHKWPDISRKLFDGKTAREAVQDPQLRRRVAASILNTEMLSQESPTERLFPFNELRRELGLPPEPESILVEGAELQSLSVTHLGRVDVSGLSDEDLTYLFNTCLSRNLRFPLRKAGLELVSRSSVSQDDRAQIYASLLRVSVSADESLMFIEAGRKTSLELGDQTVMWDLAELEVRIQLGQPEKAQQLIRQLAEVGRQVPEVMQHLYQLLSRYGLVQGPGDAPGGGAQAEPEAAQAEPAGLWTPESAAPKQESKLWLPGQ